MNMNKQQVLNKIKKGEYKITYEEACDCSFDWRLHHGTLECHEEGYECWTGHVLYIEGPVQDRPTRWASARSRARSAPVQ